MPEEVAAKENVRLEGSWAFENLKDLLIILQNFITKEPDNFINGVCPKGRYVDFNVYADFTNSRNK